MALDDIDDLRDRIHKLLIERIESTRQDGQKFLEIRAGGIQIAAKAEGRIYEVCTILSDDNFLRFAEIELVGPPVPPVALNAVFKYKVFYGYPELAD